MRLRKRIWLLPLAVLVLLPSVALYFVVSTEAGLRFMTSQLNRRIGPVTLAVEGASGTLMHGFRFERIHVQHRLSDITLRGGSGQIDFAPLMRQRIRLHGVKADSLDIQVIRSTSTGGTPRAARFMPGLLRVTVRDAIVAQGSLTLASGRRYEARNIEAAGFVRSQQVRVRRFTLDLPEQRLQAQGSGRVHSALPVGLEGDIDLRYLPPDLPVWQIAATFDGDLDALPLDIRIDAPFKATAAGAATTLNRGWHYTGKADVSEVDITDFGGGGALGLIAGTLDIEASDDGYLASGPLNPAGLGVGAFETTFDGFYRDRELTIRSATARHRAAGTRMNTRGSVRVQEGGPALDLSGNWTAFRWPLTGEEIAVTSAQGRYRISGTRPWTVEAEGEFGPAALASMPFTVTGRLSPERFDFEKAQVQVMGGQAQVAGHAQWNPTEQWHIEGRAERIDPSALRADMPGRLAFDFRASGAPFGSDAALSVGIGRLSGELRGASAGGQGQAERAAGSEDWQFSNVDLRFGRTLLQLDGTLGAQRDLTFALDADDLSLLDAGARGRVSARGRIAGSAEAPVLLFKARGTDFQWSDFTLDALNADVDIDLAADGHTAGQVELTGARVGRRRIEQASITLSGQPAAQRIVADFHADPLRAGLIAQGTFADGTWTGQLQSLRIDDVEPARSGRLTLESPAPVAFSARGFTLDDVCVTGNSARMCLDLHREAASWQARLSAGQLPLRVLTAGLSQDIDYNGSIDLVASAAGEAGALPTGELRATLGDTELLEHLGNGRTQRIALGSGRVDAAADATSFNVTVGLDAGEAGHVRGRLQGERQGSRWQDHPIRGELEAATDGLGILEAHVAEIDRATGRLRAEVMLGGTLGEPAIEGRLELRDSRIDVYQVNLSLQDLSVDATFDANALQIAGSTRLGEGTAKVDGRLSWRNREPYGELRVEGENLLVVDVPEASIHASPALDFKLAGRRIDATGTVNIPRARLAPADLTNAVLASGDEVIVGEQPRDPEDGWLVVSDIQMQLGNDVTLDTLGLEARLGGGITVRTDEAGVSRGTGELNIASGRYRALGRLLDISRGRLLFNSGPLGDPGIDLRAQKEFPDIVAGVNVRGTLRAPRMTFFSEPSIPQSQIASLILAGGSLESVQDGNGTARNDLLAQGGAILAQQIGSRVGIEDVSIESDLSNETSLVLGKYLSPRLYVSYGISLAEAINTLKLRYTISDSWTLKTESGKARSADLEYTILK